MPQVLLDTAPADAAQILHEQSGVELLSFFKFLPWDGFLATFLDEQTNGVLKNLLSNLIAGMDIGNSGQAVLPLGETSKPDLIAELQSVYLLRSTKNVTVSTVVADIERAWSAREDDVGGRKSVGQAINILFIKDNAHKVSLVIAKAIDALGIKCEEMRTGGGRPSKFHTGSNRGALASKQIHAFWQPSVSESSVDGFIGRCYEEEVESRRLRFHSIWKKDDLYSLDSFDAKKLAVFLSHEGEAVSPSAASSRRLLERWLVDQVPDVRIQESSALPFALEEPTQNPPTTGAKPLALVPKSKTLSRHKDGRAPVQNRRVAKGIVDHESESDASTDNSFLSDDSPDEDFVCPSRTRQSSKFPGLPRKMIQVLEQGGPEFEELFEPPRVDITTPRERYKLLKYFNDGQRVARELCRASGLIVDPVMCVEKLEVGKISRIRPDHRLADTLSFDPTTRRAPRILHRWLSHGSIIPWLNSLCARAGQVEKDNADGYLAREIMTAGLTLASLLNEFHPAHLLYSSAVERLVRRLWVIEKVLSMERQERGPYLIQMLGFMGIGHGPCTEPEELK